VVSSGGIGVRIRARIIDLVSGCSHVCILVSIVIVTLPCQVRVGYFPGDIISRTCGKSTAD